jgi:hypothetical protein
MSLLIVDHDILNILGMIESPLITHAESIQLASYMDALRASVGVVFEEDKQ